MSGGLGWLGIIRLGLVQTALGAVVVLTTSTINRVMVVELALPATLAGLLVGLHYGVQMSRPRMGFGSDVGGRRTPWIIGGIALLGLGGLGAAAAVPVMQAALLLGLALAALAFIAVGMGVAASGTSLLALLASEVAPARRPAAATIVWIMMIAGFAVTAGVAGRLLDPFSPARLIAVTGGVSLFAVALATVAVWGVERQRIAPAATAVTAKPDFRAALRSVWAEPDARRFTIFVFVSMLAYSASDLILEPFAGQVYGRSIGESTSLAGVQNGGTLIGMIVVALLGNRFGGLRGWAVGGCIASAVVLFVLALGGAGHIPLPLAATYAALGVANGAFAAAAIASMMMLASQGRSGREGTRIGLWGAAQAVAFGLGGLAGTIVVDLGRWLMGAHAPAYAVVFAIEGGLFLLSAMLAAGIDAQRARDPAPAVFQERRA